MTDLTTNAVIANGLEAMADAHRIMAEGYRINGRSSLAASYDASADALIRRARMTRAGIVGVVDGEGR
jgi:hypothetical protein